MQHTTDAESEPGLPPTAAPLPAIEASRQAVPHAALEEARRRVLEALERGAPVVALVGAAGTGKTLLLGQLAEILRGRQDGVLLLRTTHDLLTYRAEAGDAALAASTVLLDEADRSGDDQIAPLLGVGQAAHLPPRILVGLPPLLRRLEALGRPAVAVTLGPVSRAELPGFVAARLAAAGYPPDLFAAEAVEEIARRSGGVPRLVNVLTKAAAFAASLEGSPEVLAHHVVEATRHAAGIAPATRTAPPPDPAEPPTPRPRPEEGAPPTRPHLVDAAAEWVDGLRPLPPAAPPPTAPVVPAAAPPSGDAPAGSPLPEVAADATFTAPVTPPTETVPATADEIAIPPQPVAEARLVAPAPGRIEPPTNAAKPSSGSDAPPVRPVSPAAAEPVLAEPAPAVSPARRRRGGGWVLAIVALLILVGAAVAVERSKDAPPGSPLARLAPARAWLAERTDLDRIMVALRSDSGSSTATRTAPAAVAPEPSAATVPPAPAPAPPAPTVAPAPAPVATPEPVAAPEPAAPRPDLSGPPPATSAAPAVPTEPASSTPPPAAAEGNAAPAAEPSAPVAIPPVPPLNQGFLAPPAPPAPAEAPARTEAPRGPPARVIVHFLSATPQERSERLLAGLTARYPDLQVRRGGRGPSFAVVRHFLPADAGSAETVAGLLASSGVEARVQDFSSYRPRPRPGTIEVWLP
ncbi:ATP-binding protein [Muricoccus aerilatus]|uniref:ATP-binding protein n=1 Tax=Muricoccus aerilatus TaxID=452982 RepID=UPI000693E498|nr:ATP-binding protein [Roseomonas aerilata]